MSDIHIKKAQPDDLHGIRTVQKITWLATYPNSALGITHDLIAKKFAKDDTPAAQQRMKRRKRRLSDPRTLFLVAKNADTVVGFCWARKLKDEQRIQAIYLLPEYQGQGIGMRLLQQALLWFQSNTPVYVNVASYNEQAIRFYEKCGFHQTGKVVHDAVAELAPGVSIPEIEMIREL